ncbi:MAG: phage head-tail joining protein [Cypionkella sp.]
MAGLTIAQVTALRDELVDLRVSGVRVITHQNGQSAIYKSFSEMAAAIAAIDSQIAAAGQSRVGRFTFNTSKGL